MKSAIAFILAACALAGCVTDPTLVSPKTILDVSQGRSSAIVFSMRDRMNCTTDHVAMSPAESSNGARYLDGASSLTIPTGVMPPGGVDATIVAPGVYNFTQAKCTLPWHIYYSTRMLVSRALASWFEPVEVKAGEVVYLGTLEMESIDVKREMPAIEQLWNLVTVTGLGPDRYPVFTVKDETEATRAKLRQTHPELADRMITRLPKPILSRDAFAEAFRNAYAPNPDGSLPTREEAEARLDREMDIAVERSRAARRRETPPPPPLPGRPAPPLPNPISFSPGSPGAPLAD